MFRFIEVETRSRSVPVPNAKLETHSLPEKHWWWGGVSWEKKLDRPLVVLVEDSSEAPPGLTDFFRTTDVYIVSSRMRSVLEAVGAEIEFWPVTLRYSAGRVLTPYFAANALVRLKALDATQSVVELDPELGDALAVEKLVLDERRLIGRRWSVVDEVHRVAVDGEVQAALLESKCSGFQFIDPIDVRY